jgi:hypothetical protein
MRAAAAAISAPETLHDVPAMAEGIGELPVAFAPELIGDLVVNFRPCFERARP